MNKFTVSYRPTFSTGERHKERIHFFLPNEDGKTILYAYIRKNGCSAFKMLMLKKAGTSSINEIENKFGIRNPSENVTWDDAVFVYRDPFERAVSTFANKFVDRYENVDLFKNYERVTGKWAACATFGDFVDYLKSPLPELDPHVLPQRGHLLDIEYSHALELSDLYAGMRAIAPSIAHFFKYPINKSVRKSDCSVDLTNTPADEISEYSTMSFSSLKPEIERIYLFDVDMVQRLKKKRRSTHFSVGTN